ncbi:hypothetical protein Csa_006369 [Cucumis sativus]|uniref:Uncharacterized protein n=1 Tax=Cucumis sativus TaxID=3659 RepID=A0A0A0LLE1_CUCSA|nr:hypothetical protein Csa_006369 [Cucumis sativus]
MLTILVELISVSVFSNCLSLNRFRVIRECSKLSTACGVLRGLRGVQRGKKSCSACDEGLRQRAQRSQGKVYGEREGDWKNGKILEKGRLRAV